jgi:hypothetical protein
MDMPKEAQPGNHTHQIDENDGGEIDVAGTLPIAGDQSHEKRLKSEVVKEIEELVKETRFAQSVDFGDVFSLSQFCGDPSLVPGSGAPCESVGDIL